ncbi:hypothetical protein HY946_01090, partial [Candidatus Gottesmanbacteria bacterium]|nr:hypothetical protein [Candidatus Gottesmanbacteria bacterium]
WEEIPGSGSWIVESGQYVGSVPPSPATPSQTFAGDNSWSDYAVEVSMTGVSGVDRHILIRYDPTLWPSSSPGYAIKYREADYGFSGHIELQKAGIKVLQSNSDFKSHIGETHRFRIEAKGNRIIVYGDGTLLLDFIDDENPIFTGRLGFFIEPSGIGLTNTTAYDDVIVETLEPSPTPTPSPTPAPTPVPTTKIVMIPGLGASWNADAILNCKLDGYSGDWVLAPYASDIYSPLLNALGDKGKPFYYDWRKDVRNQSTPLKNFINEQLTDGEKIHLVGHSLGGLVGRAYLGNQNTSSRLDKLLTVGSPHQGAPQSYPAWSGGEIWEDNFIYRIAMNILLRRCVPLRNSRETIQRVIPSIKNLLPIFDYLKDKKTGLLKPVGEMKAKNNWLPTSFLPPFWGVTVGTLSGNGFPTLKTILVKERSRLDARLGNWADGKPAGKENVNEGDGTILLSSSQLTDAENQTINQNHSGLIASSEGIGRILSFLGIGVTSALTTSYSEPKSALIIMGYPSSFWVMDQDGKIVKDKDGMVSLINPKGGKYKFGLLPKSTKALFIIAQFLEDGRVFWKEYNFKYFLPKLGIINFNPTNPQEDALRLIP